MNKCAHDIRILDLLHPPLEHLRAANTILIYTEFLTSILLHLDEDIRSVLEAFKNQQQIASQIKTERSLVSSSPSFISDFLARDFDSPHSVPVRGSARWTGTIHSNNWRTFGRESTSSHNPLLVRS